MKTSVTKSCRVTIRRSSHPTVNFHLRRGLGFQALAAKNTTPIEFDCRDADCAICIFSVLSGNNNLSPISNKEQECLRAIRAEPEERLACQTRILGDVSIFIDE